MRKTILAIAAAAAFSLPLAAADVSGSWSVAGDIVGNALNMQCNFKQEGTKFAGTCGGGAAGSMETSGEVSGNKVVFYNVAQGQYELTWTGMLDDSGTKMNGEIAVAGVTGTFSATKAVMTPPAPPAAPAAPAASGNVGKWNFTGSVAGRDFKMACDFNHDAAGLAGNCKYDVGAGDSPTRGTMDGHHVVLHNTAHAEQDYDLTFDGTLSDDMKSIKGSISVMGIEGAFSGTRAD